MVFVLDKFTFRGGKTKWLSTIGSFWELLVSVGSQGRGRHSAGDLLECHQGHLEETQELS